MLNSLLYQNYSHGFNSVNNLLTCNEMIPKLVTEVIKLAIMYYHIESQRNYNREQELTLALVTLQEDFSVSHA